MLRILVFGLTNRVMVALPLASILQKLSKRKSLQLVICLLQTIRYVYSGRYSKGEFAVKMNAVKISWIISDIRDLKVNYFERSYIKTS